jgi:hypothetical protein
MFAWKQILKTDPKIVIVYRVKVFTKVIKIRSEEAWVWIDNLFKREVQAL